MERIKASGQAQVVSAALRAIGTLPRRGAQAWADALSRPASMVVTNVAGPAETLHIGGRAVGSLMIWVPTTGTIGLGISICTYAGQLGFGVITDTATIADAGTVTAALEAATAASLREIGGTHLPQPPMRAVVDVSLR